MKRTGAAFCVLLLLVACDTVHQVDPVAEPNAFDHINAQCAGRLVTIEPVAGKPLRGTGFRVTGSTASWRQYGGSRDQVTMETSGIRAIRILKTTGRGARLVAGLGLGLTVGLMLGNGIAASLDREDFEGYFFPDTYELARTQAIVYTTIAGGLAGIVVGVALAPEEVYVMPSFDTGHSVGAGMSRDAGLDREAPMPPPSPN
jgi:hypothetical protein